MKSSGEKTHSCAICSGKLVPHLEKAAADGKKWQIWRCLQCTLWQIHPLPSPRELNALYQGDYFHKRTDRGYADYTSPQVRNSVLSTLEKNLRDLDFFSWENSLSQHERTLLEIGCAAGHAVGYFAARGWQTLGIDIAGEMVEAGKKLGYNLICADFLEHDFGSQKFQLITHWATLEHLVEAKAFLLRMAELLLPQGKIYLSTCNTGYFARRYGAAWRYLNVPEHVFYFNHHSLSVLASQCRLKITRAFSYGSGYTSRADAPWHYRLRKRIADRLARFFLSGDMIVVELKHATTLNESGVVLQR